MQPSSQLYPGIHTYLKMLASTHTRPSMAHVRHDDDWLSDVRQHPVARSVIHQCAAVPGNQSIGKVHLQRLCTHHLLTRQMQKLLTVLPEHPCNCALLHSSMQASTLHSRFKRPHTGLPTTPAPIPRGDELSSMQSACPTPMCQGSSCLGAARNHARSQPSGRSCACHHRWRRCCCIRWRRSGGKRIKYICKPVPCCRQHAHLF